MKRCLTLCLAVVFIFIVSLGANADSYDYSINISPATYYDTDSMVPSKAFVFQQNETVDMYTGSLSYSVTDLNLPGRKDLDLILTRTYNSNYANMYYMDVKVNVHDDDVEIAYDEFWDCITASGTVHIRICNFPKEKQMNKRYGLGVGWCWSL